MRTKTLLLGVVLVSLALPVSLSAGQNQNNDGVPGPVTIDAKPGSVVFSSPVSLTGRVQDGRNVAVLLQTSVDRQNWTTIQRGMTANNGRYSFGHRPRRNTYYRVVLEATPETASPPLLVRVRMLVGLRVSDSTPSRGERVRFFGIVRPPHDGRRAYVQKRSSNGRWVTVARTALRSLDAQSSRYSRRVRVRRNGTYRVRVLGHGDHAMGISRERTLTVG